MSSTYRSKRVNSNDEDWAKRMEKIMEKKIKKVMKEKRLQDPIDLMIKPPFTKKILEYMNSEKLKPPAINLYNGTNDLNDHIQTFQSHMHYVGILDAIMCQAFFTIFRIVARDWYAILKSKSIGLFKEFT